MTTDLKLFGKIIALPPALKEEALKYISYLQFSQNQEVSDKKIKKTPKAGFSQVDFILSEDFDAPLEDFKAYME